MLLPNAPPKFSYQVDGRGLEYGAVRFCEYVQKYYAVKVKYGFSFSDNKIQPFESCGITTI